MPLALLVSLVGCGSQPNWDQESKQDLFAPTAMRIHPVFTQVRDWTGDGKPDGIEVFVEFQDRFGDPSKAAGNMVFEVYQYRPGWPDPRGERLGTPYVVSIDSVATQREHWNRTARAYSFQLALPSVSPRQTYVLTTSVDAGNNQRFFDRFTIEPATPAVPETPASGPANQPGVRTPNP